MTTIHYSNQTEIGIEKVYIKPLDFIKLLEAKTFEFDRDSTLEQIKRLQGGEFIARIYKDDTCSAGTDYFIFGPRKQMFDMRYSNMTDRTLGSELLYSSMPMPDVRDFLPHYQK